MTSSIKPETICRSVHGTISYKSREDKDKELMQRHSRVQTQGWQSAITMPYQALGQPNLDIQEMDGPTLRESLRPAISTHSDMSSHLITPQEDKQTHTETFETCWIEQDGYGSLKDAIERSNARVRSCRVGQSLRTLCPRSKPPTPVETPTPFFITEMPPEPPKSSSHLSPEPLVWADVSGKVRRKSIMTMDAHGHIQIPSPSKQTTQAIPKIHEQLETLEPAPMAIEPTVVLKSARDRHIRHRAHGTANETGAFSLRGQTRLGWIGEAFSNVINRVPDETPTPITCDDETTAEEELIGGVSLRPLILMKDQAFLTRSTSLSSTSTTSVATEQELDEEAALELEIKTFAQLLEQAVPSHIQTKNLQPSMSEQRQLKMYAVQSQDTFMNPSHAFCEMSNTFEQKREQFANQLALQVNQMDQQRISTLERKSKALTRALDSSLPTSIALLTMRLESNMDQLSTQLRNTSLYSKLLTFLQKSGASISSVQSQVLLRLRSLLEEKGVSFESSHLYDFLLTLSPVEHRSTSVQRILLYLKVYLHISDNTYRHWLISNTLPVPAYLAV